MKKIIFIAVTIVLFSSVGLSQTVKIAYVNSETILRELPDAQQVKKELEDTIKVWQDELSRMSQELRDGSDDYQKKEALLRSKSKS